MSCFESISKWRYPRELLDDYVEIDSVEVANDVIKALAKGL